MRSLKQTFEFWITIGRALKVLKQKAEQFGNRKTFDRPREREGLGRSHIDKARVWKILRIIDSLPAIEEWRATLTENQRFEWQSPESICRRFPGFNRPKPANENRPMSLTDKLAERDRELVHLKAHVAEIETRGDGSQFTKDDTAKQIAGAVTGTPLISVSKVETVARELLAWVKAQRG